MSADIVPSNERRDQAKDDISAIIFASPIQMSRRRPIIVSVNPTASGVSQAGATMAR